MTYSRTLMGASGLLIMAALATPGCATKKYVRQQAGAVDQRVSEVDKKHAQAISNLEGKEQKDVSRVEERAMSAENKANDAARAAQAADQRAAQAGDAAKNATDLAQQAHTKIGDVQTAVQNIDNFKLVNSEGVLFGFNKANLTKDGEAKLDQIVQSTQGMGRYLVEVQGFTDKTGPRDYNLALSRRRADTVVRYLVDKGVPLRRIHMIGLGYDTNTSVLAANQSAMSGQASSESDHRMTRKEQRRVMINLYTPETTLSASSGSPQSQGSQPVQTQSNTQSQPSPSPR